MLKADSVCDPERSNGRRSETPHRHGYDKLANEKRADFVVIVTDD